MNKPEDISVQEYEDDYDDDDDTFCHACGRNLNEDISGCPECNPCGGIYEPGTEECDWCEYSEECASLDRVR